MQWTDVRSWTLSVAIIFEIASFQIIDLTILVEHCPYGLANYFLDRRIILDKLDLEAPSQPELLGAFKSLKCPTLPPIMTVTLCKRILNCKRIYYSSRLPWPVFGLGCHKWSVISIAVVFSLFFSFFLGSGAVFFFLFFATNPISSSTWSLLKRFQGRSLQSVKYKPEEITTIYRSLALIHGCL